MARSKPPITEIPPLCRCGCGESVNWKPGKGWATWKRGHSNRGRPSPLEGKRLPEQHRRRISRALTLRGISKRRGAKEKRETLDGVAPLCGCGCGEIVNWNRQVGWPVYRAGHSNRKHWPGTDAPVCECGCGEEVALRRGSGWSRYREGHNNRNKTFSEQHRRRMSEAHKKRVAGKRRRDADPTGPGVYSTHEYREARKQLVEGRACAKCGASENIHAHHQVPGDDSTLIPLCAKCHPRQHAKPGAKGPTTVGEAPPCSCGCGQPVGWKRVRGWAKYRKGHGGSKVPAVSKLAAPPPCECGCGEPVAFRHGEGWNQYKRGHGQRVEGHYTAKRIKSE